MQASTGYCTRTLKADSEWVRRVALSDDGEMLASCGNDQSVKVGGGVAGVRVSCGWVALVNSRSFIFHFLG